MGTHTNLDAVYEEINKTLNDKVEPRSKADVDAECIQLAEAMSKNKKVFNFRAFVRSSGLEYNYAKELLNNHGYEVVGEIVRIAQKEKTAQEEILK